MSEEVLFPFRITEPPKGKTFIELNKFPHLDVDSPEFPSGKIPGICQQKFYGSCYNGLIHPVFRPGAQNDRFAQPHSYYWSETPKIISCMVCPANS